MRKKPQNELNDFCVSRISSNSGETQFSLKNRLRIMGDVVLSGLFNKNNNMGSASLLIPWCIFLPPSQQMSVSNCIVLCCCGSTQKGSTQLEYTARHAQHTSRDPS